MAQVWERVLQYMKEHPGRSIGTALGLLCGMCLISLGLWKTLVLGTATFLGYYIGKWIDDEGRGIREFLEEKLPGRPDFH
ncbi:MAG: DUF2273 domain-containing protein [Firmicutes bacterium]|nr:DUF2273 domain-containing protein [Candidatus Fermentithermobacillaceae bacterium]